MVYIRDPGLEVAMLLFSVAVVVGSLAVLDWLRGLAWAAIQLRARRLRLRKWR